MGLWKFHNSILLDDFLKKNQLTAGNMLGVTTDFRYMDYGTRQYASKTGSGYGTLYALKSWSCKGIYP